MENLKVKIARILCLPMLILICLVPAKTFAQADDKKDDELDQVLKNVAEAHKGYKDIRAKVRYTRTIEALDKKKVSNGSIEYIKPNWLHLKLDPPRDEEVVMDDQFVWVVSHNQKQVEKYKKADGSAQNSEAAFIEFAYKGSTEELKKRYNITLAEKDTKGKRPRYKLSLEPKAEKGNRFSHIELWLNSEHWLPDAMVLREAEGEILHEYEFVEIEWNKGMDAKDLKFIVPRGYDVIEP